MDSLTQLVFGAAVGEATLGRVAHRRGAAYGALCGTLPDLDVAWPYADAVAAFTWHRTYSHSLLILSLVAVVMFVLIRRFDVRAAGPPGVWLLGLWLALVTHPLLDALTVYGTQLLLPFSDYPVSGSALFIIDPLFTLPLLIFLIAALRSADAVSGQRLARVGLTIACAYAGAAVGAKLSVEHQLREALDERGVAPVAVLTTPSPFNIVLWRAVVMFDDRYEVSYHRLIGGAERPTPRAYPNGHERLVEVRDYDAVRRLAWFTHGFYKVRQSGDELVVTDLRMGIEQAYVFSFAVARQADDGWTHIEPQPIPPPDLADGFAERLADAWQQASDSAVVRVQ